MCYDGDGPDFPVRAKVQTAAKPYTCGECSLPIAVGERYEYLWGRWEGYADTVRTCLRCMEARRWLDVVCQGWQFHSVLDDLREHYGEGYRDPAMARLVILAGGGNGNGRGGYPGRWRTLTGELVPVERVRELVSASLAATPADHKGGH